MSRLRIAVACMALIAVSCSGPSETADSADLAVRGAAAGESAATTGQVAPLPAPPKLPPEKKDLPVERLQSGDLAMLGALSEEEAAWLEEHGFPTAEELGAVPLLEEEELFNAMHQGNAKAAALLGHVRALKGDFAGASSAFYRGMQLGSIYAMEQHAIHGLIEASDVQDGRIIATPSAIKALFVAEMEVARMLGDHRVDHYIRQYASGLDMSIHADDILSQTAEYMRQYGMSEAPRAPDPRPNASLWSQVDAADPDGIVSVYLRPSTFP